MSELLIGSITHSFAKYKDGVRERFGGGIMYGGRTAAVLGIETTVVTIGANDLDPAVSELKSLGLKVQKVKRQVSNNFSNDYSGNERKLYLRSFIDEPLTGQELTGNTKGFNCVILFPLFNEITPEILDSFNDSQIILLDPQGLTRTLGEKNNEGLMPIIQSQWENIDDFKGKIDVLKLSDEDLKGIKFPEEIISEEEKIKYLNKIGFPLVILTRGIRSTLVAGDSLNLTEVPVLKVESIVDTAGAGETFAVAFMYKYFESKDPILSVKFANICSGLKVSGEDFSVEKIEEKLRESIS